ncbi:MAG TPA: twin-arginine translocation signal domain-containing protein [Chthoniobacter sp.]|nr:twin-arginine translocation signal domain-containing protein [Chthoniobacter sp.]
MNTPWTRRHFLQASGLGAAATLLSTTRAQDIQKTKPDAQMGAIDISDRRQLFIDDMLLDLERTQNVARRLNGPHKIQQILKPEQPWEKLGFVFYCGVIDDGGTAKLYHSSYDAEKKKHCSLAISTDGIHWQRPKLGLRAYEGSKENNLLQMNSVEAAMFLDPHSPPEKRYRMVFTRGWPDPAKAGVCVASSPDGLHWSEVSERCLPFIPDNQPTAFWDERIGKYVIYVRAWNPIRTVARVEVDDLEKPWPYDASVPPLHVWGKDKIPTVSRELPTVLAYDEQDQPFLQPYTAEVLPYPGSPDVYFAFPADFQLYKEPQWKARGLTTNDGTFDVGFATSRDGITWNRWRQPYIPTGMYDDLDLRLVSMGFGVVRRGPWLHQYFVGWPYTHGRPEVWERDPASRAAWYGKNLGGIYCATQRVDGYLSMDAANGGGTLTTRPLSFKGNRLRLNVHTTGGGNARVALLDAQGTALPGFSADECEVIQDDAIDFEVRWKNGPDVNALAGQPLRVQVTMRNAKLYALQFTA